MTTDLRTILIKVVSSTIGQAATVKPELQAEAAIDRLLEEYDIMPKIASEKVD